MEPSFPLTSTLASVPSLTVTSTGLVKPAFFVPSAGVTVTVGVLTSAFVLAPAVAPAFAPVPSEASAEPLHPARMPTAGTAPRATSTPRRDQACRSDGLVACRSDRFAVRRSDRFELFAKPTARLSWMTTTTAGASCAAFLG